jgi:hypothetical protein
MKIEYTIQEVATNVFAVIVPDSYHRAMLFCRTQEYYESPNEKFRGQSFSIFDYIEWYSRQNGGSFTYAQDWGGFNIPYDVARDCHQVSPKESPYDSYMGDILRNVSDMMQPKSAYLLGVENITDDTFQHEVCHGLYHTNREYRESMDEITKSMASSYWEKFKDNLIEMGYTMGVINDEIQAYMTINWDYQRFCKGVPKKVRQKLNQKYVEVLKKYHTF